MRALAILALAACGAGGADAPTTDAPDDAPPGCVVGISDEVVPPFASPSTFVRAVANVQNSSGQHTYDWFVLFNDTQQLPFTFAAVDNSAIKFDAVNPGVYRVRYRIEDPFCLEASTEIEVKPPGVGTTVMRVHVVAPPDEGRPPVDKQELVQGGPLDLIEDVQLATGVAAVGTVSLDGSPVSSYMRFMPAVGSDAIVETYSDALGNYTTELRGETHSVLIIPTTGGVSPQIATWSPGQTTIALQQGTQVTGTVVDSAAAVIAGASVQVTINGVPSTIATTDNTGFFELFAPTASGKVRFEVIPPPTTGLPRLVAEATQFTVGTNMAIQFAAQTTRDLTTATVQRGGTGLGGATVVIVGTLPAPAGTITLGASLNATGEVRASAVTAGNGDLPTLRVPAAALHAVIFPGGAGDHAVTPIDVTSSVPATINAAVTQQKSTQLTSSTGTVLPGAILDAVPDGPLALAGAPTIRRVAGPGGNLTIELAPNATYDLRLSDPNGNRGALEVVEDRNTTNLAATNALSKATKVSATVIGNGPIAGAIVQFLCANCTGIERSRPIAEGVTGIDGRFSLAVPDNN